MQPCALADSRRFRFAANHHNAACQLRPAWQNRTAIDQLFCSVASPFVRSLNPRPWRTRIDQVAVSARLRVPVGSLTGRVPVRA